MLEEMGETFSWQLLIVSFPALQAGYTDSLGSTNRYLLCLLV